ncbi:MAG: ABC transporter permease [Chloroflexi bacterium]|nr:ABC transporter permease [Chloroflexota bacterium]
MLNWIRRRLLFLLLVFIAAVIISFALPRLMPGDITDQYVSSTFDTTTAQSLQSRFGLDKPIIVQFWLYFKNTFTGNFGISFDRYPTPVITIIKQALPKSLTLILTSEFIYIIIGYFLGVKAGWKAGSKTDAVITGSSMFTWAAPVFWVAMMILFLFSFQLRWFPLGGYRTAGAEYSNWFQLVGDVIYHSFLPIISLVICRFGSTQIKMRNTITITLKENYITTAKAKGLSESRIKHRHAARNALLPLVTSTSFGVAMAVSGSIFIETIFSYPGMGRLIFNAVMQKDYPVLQACFLIFALMIIGIVFVLDLIYARLDPRVRLS